MSFDTFRRNLEVDYYMCYIHWDAPRDIWDHLRDYYFTMFYVILLDENFFEHYFDISFFMYFIFKFMLIFDSELQDFPGNPDFVDVLDL